MKKTALILIVLVLLSALIPGCRRMTANQRRFSAPDPLPDVVTIARENKSGYTLYEPVGEDEGFPVYKESELLNYSEHSLWPELDTTYLSGARGDVSLILGHFPTEKIRMRDDGALILAYAVDSGSRVFCICDPKQNNYGELGHAIVVGSAHSYEEFKELKVGDPLEKVEEIDEAGASFGRMCDIHFTDPGGYPNAHMGFKMDFLYEGDRHIVPFSTIHYLTDGIVKIDYEMLEDDQTILISDIVYSEDYILPDCLGNPIDYTLCEDDLPF